MASQNIPLTLLGGITPEKFLKIFWQKKPLLIRNAIPDFTGILAADELAGLACEEDVQSRIVTNIDDVWALENGPFPEDHFAKLPETNWSLLVQNVNHYLPEANELLKKFNFIPQARLDDLMVSYAPEGGSVGPHFDSYDVFLLQGQGKRLWKVSKQTDLTLVDNAPLSILKNFDSSQELLLEPGDMLYLPPKLAHWGIAQASPEGCMTYSIGFRAPKSQELATEFLAYLQDQFSQENKFIDGMYEDPDLIIQENSAEISGQMIGKVSRQLRAITWSNADIGKFIGRYLSEPKPDVVFTENEKITMKVFVLLLVSNVLVLDSKSKLLFTGEQFFMNGEALSIAKDRAEPIKKLAHDGQLLPETINQYAAKHPLKNITCILFEWYNAGYCHFIEE